MIPKKKGPHGVCFSANEAVGYPLPRRTVSCPVLCTQGVVPLCVERLGCAGLRVVLLELNKRFRNYLREKEFGEKAKQRFKTVLNVLNRSKGV